MKNIDKNIETIKKKMEEIEKKRNEYSPKDLAYLQGQLDAFQFVKDNAELNLNEY